MKKILSLLLALALALTALASCSSQPSANNNTDPPAETSSPAPGSTPEPTPYPTPGSDSNQLTVKEFPFSIDVIIPSLNETLSSNNYAELGDPVANSENSEALGAHTTYTYSLGDGASLSVYVSDSTNNILEFFLIANTSKMSEDTILYTSFVIGCIEGGIAGEDAERIDEELGIDFSNLTEDTMSFASTSAADFTYMVNGGTVSFMVMPL